MLGHVNVWFGQERTDVALTRETTTGEGMAQLTHAAPRVGPTLSPILQAAFLALPTAGTGIRGFHH